MTNIDDARVEAERRYPVRTLSVEDGETPDPRFEPFVAGAEWQASRTPVVADREALTWLRNLLSTQPDRPVTVVPTHTLRVALSAPVVPDVDTIARWLYAAAPYHFPPPSHAAWGYLAPLLRGGS